MNTQEYIMEFGRAILWGGGLIFGAFVMFILLGPIAVLIRRWSEAGKTSNEFLEAQQEAQRRYEKAVATALEAQREQVLKALKARADAIRDSLEDKGQSK